MKRFDEAILLSVAEWRSPLLNRVMMDVSSLGSPTILILITVTAFTLFWINDNRWAAAKVVAASAGAEVWIEIIKRVVGRPRPSIVPYLVDFTGFSFPGGHALAATATYGTLAAIACSDMQQRGARIAIRSICWVVIGMVAASRVYLGVHYPTDVVGGVVIGLAWVYLLDYAFERFFLPPGSGRSVAKPF
jgi:undecaprenyl-diphosphatase